MLLMIIMLVTLHFSPLYADWRIYINPVDKNSICNFWLALRLEFCPHCFQVNPPRDKHSTHPALIQCLVI